jgi:hypothetical protein
VPIADSTCQTAERHLAPHAGRGRRALARRVRGTLGRLARGESRSLVARMERSAIRDSSSAGPGLRCAPSGLQEFNHTFAIPRRVSPGVCVLPFVLFGKRAQGKPGARCTRGLACKIVQKSAHEHTGSAEAVRPSLRNGFNGFLRALPGDRALLSPSLANESANLTPASRRQDHTTSPSAIGAVRQRRFLRPPHPAPRP